MESPAQEVPCTPRIERETFLPQTPVAVVPDDFSSQHSQDDTFNVPGTPSTPLAQESPWLQRSTPRSRRSGSGIQSCSTPRFGYDSPWRPNKPPQTGRRSLLTPRLLVGAYGAASPATQVVPTTPKGGFVCRSLCTESTLGGDMVKSSHHPSPSLKGHTGPIGQQEIGAIVDASGDHGVTTSKSNIRNDGTSRQKPSCFPQVLRRREKVARFRRSPEARGRSSATTGDFLDTI